MNATHIHLLINHVAVVGSFCGIVVLLFAIRSKEKNTFLAAYSILIMAAISASIAYATGESAEETVEGIVGISESVIEEHEEAAGFALGSFITLGVLSIAGVYIAFKKENLLLTWGKLMMAVCIISFCIVGRTAWLGGKIRHTEVSQSQTNGQEETDDD